MSTVNPEEIQNFEQQAHSWWDETGPFKPLHKINPVRMGFIRQEVCTHFSLKESPTPFEKMSFLDVGCGGGLVCEPLARLGAKVTGIDAGAENITVAQQHAQEMDLTIDYQCTTSEDLAATGNQYDVVTALEIVEHVEDVGLFIESLCKLVKPGGLLIMSTLNRTLKSYALGIVAAEYILRWVPTGTHQWHKFLEPAELGTLLESNGANLSTLKGITFDIFSRSWRLNDTDFDVNYLLSATKDA